MAPFPGGGRGGADRDGGPGPCRRAEGGRWSVLAGEYRITTGTVVDAAGAWADEIAGILGAAPLGLVPLRRTAALATVLRALDPEHPVVCTTGDGRYHRPEGDRVLVSPSEAEPSEPCDARQHEGGVERRVARIERATALEVTGIDRVWTGLRTEAPDGVPVCGFDAAGAR